MSKLSIHSVTLCDIAIQIVTHRVDWFSCLTFVLLQYTQHGRKSYILNYMWTAANFIIEGRRLCTVGLHAFQLPASRNMVICWVNAMTSCDCWPYHLHQTTRVMTGRYKRSKWPQRVGMICFQMKQVYRFPDVSLLRNMENDAWIVNIISRSAHLEAVSHTCNVTTQNRAVQSRMRSRVQ